MLNTSLAAVVTTEVKEIVKVSGWKLLGFSTRTPSCKMAREFSYGVIWGIANPGAIATTNSVNTSTDITDL